jgi:hypothetical protein
MAANETTYRPGDTDVDILRKVLFKIVTDTTSENYPRSGDTFNVLLRKLLTVLNGS